MELGEQRLDEAQLRNMSTVELVRHAMTEMKLLIRAEMLHARTELKAELKEARNAGIMIGIAVFLAPAGLAIALMAVTKASLTTVIVAITIPQARFTDWLIARDRRQRQAGGRRHGSRVGDRAHGA